MVPRDTRQRPALRRGLRQGLQLQRCVGGRGVRGWVLGMCGSWCVWISASCAWMGAWCAWISASCAWMGAWCAWMGAWCVWMGVWCAWMGAWCVWMGGGGDELCRGTSQIKHFVANFGGKAARGSSRAFVVRLCWNFAHLIINPKLHQRRGRQAYNVARASKMMHNAISNFGANHTIEV